MEIKSEKIDIVDIESIIENPENNNRHSIEQLELLEKGIKYNGFRNPLIISKRSGFLIAGHARLQAAKNLGMKSVPVIYQDFQHDAEEYQYLTFDNESARWSQLDRHAVYNKLENLDFDLDSDLLGIQNFSFGKLDSIEEINRGDENSEWVDMPEFEQADKDIKLTIIFKTELEREVYVKDNNIEITNNMNGQWTSRR